MANRIYLVASVDGCERFLVRANTPAQARNHVVRTLYEVKVPDADELVAATLDGIKVETAGETDAQA